ncbi:MAG: thiamine phosphate synthase [Bacteroidales bacterium]|nr:thiamine phosphate synthase [Bacteroidales bacterium]
MNNYRLQFITHCTERYSYVDSARIALEGGCRWIQLRMKDAGESLMEETAHIVQKMCKDYGATFIIDDNVNLVKKIKADGVHLGKNDMPIAEARKILGDDFIIGGTVNCFEDILKNLSSTALAQKPIVNSQPPIANRQQPMVNYFGCGPFRFTSTKKNLAPILGLEGYENIISNMKRNNINIPLVAIGGITKDDISDILKTGVDGIALSGSVLKAENPVEEMKSIVEIFKSFQNK